LRREEQQIQVITIQKRESSLGLVSRQELEETYLKTQKQLLADIQISLAGYVAEEIWFGQTTSGPSSDLASATFWAARYVGEYGMGRSLIAASLDADQITESMGATLANPERRKEVDEILSDCRRRVHALLQTKRLVVEGVRDALLEREELVGDEIEVLMAELGEREPIELPTGTVGNGQGAFAPGGNGQGADPDGGASVPPTPSAPADPEDPRDAP
jgi:ATP-dependent Zn protease